MNKWLAVLVFYFFLNPANLYAESALKVFQTRQPAQALIMTIAPLYGNSAKITARNNTLIVKAPDHILLEIEQLLKQIDKPRQNLLIEVSSTLERNGAYQQDSAQGKIRIGDNGMIASHAPEYDTPNTHIRYGKNGSVIKTTHTRRSSSSSNPNHFQLRTIEGHWSTIQVGKKVPYYTSNYPMPYNIGQHRWNNSVELVDVTSGFDVFPMLDGEQVTLKIRPHNRSMNREHPDRINTRSIDTIVTGKIGQWIYLGGAINQDNQQSGSYNYSTKRNTKLDTNYRIKVNIIN